MEEIEKAILSLEEKEKTSFEEMDNLIDSIDTLINDTNNELSGEKNKNDINTKNILNNKENELRKLKLIPKVNRICNSYYHKYKELNKKIDENIKGVNYLNNDNLIKFMGNIDEKLIKEMILDHLIRKGNVKTVQKYIEESKLEISKLTKEQFMKRKTSSNNQKKEIGKDNKNGKNEVNCNTIKYNLTRMR